MVKSADTKPNQVITRQTVINNKAIESPCELGGGKIEGKSPYVWNTAEKRVIIDNGITTKDNYQRTQNDSSTTQCPECNEEAYGLMVLEIELHILLLLF